MAWTFTNDPANSVRDRVRLLCGDIVSEEPLLSDEVIDWLIQTTDNEYLAASQACYMIASRFMREADITVGELSVKLAGRARYFQERGLQLRQEGSFELGEALPTLARREARDPLFWVGQFDNKGASQ